MMSFRAELASGQSADLEGTARKLGLRLERVVITVDRHATSAALGTLALDHGGSRRAYQTI
jgi:3-oxoacyl-[acyl-carrier-protein] synthase III